MMTKRRSQCIPLTEHDFSAQVLRSETPVLVDFWAPWCGPCRAIAPVIDELAARFTGRALIGKVNVDDQPGLAERYQIRSIPTLLFFKEGKVVDRVVGAVAEPVLARKIEELLRYAGGDDDFAPGSSLRA